MKELNCSHIHLPGTLYRTYHCRQSRWSTVYVFSFERPHRVTTYDDLNIEFRMVIFIAQ